MYYREGRINNIPFWGLYEDRDKAETIINELATALSDNPVGTEKNSYNYVMAFGMNDKLYITKRNFHALVVTENNILHAKKSLTITTLKDCVLVLSVEYIDDIPKYTNAEEFCLQMSMQPAAQFCVPIPKNLD